MYKELNDQDFQKIMKTIAQNPGASLYKLAEKSGLNHTAVVRKIKGQYKLQERGLLHVEKGERNAENCWLTYKGLVYAIQIKALKPSEGHKTRINHKIGLPILPEPFSKLLKSLIQDMEKDYPELFYKAEMGATFKDVQLPMLTAAAGVMSFAKLLQLQPESVKKYIKGKNLVFSDGTVIEDYEQVFKVFMMMARYI
jgi:hypothetical protein